MAQLTKGTTIDFSTEVTSATLHTLIESALLTNLTATDLAQGYHHTSVGTATPNPSIFPLWYDTTPEDPVLRVFAVPWNIWLAVGPDRFEIPLRNDSGGIVPKGALVCATGHSNFCLQTSPSLNALGFLQTTTASGAFGPVCVTGIGWVRHMSSPSSGTVTGEPTMGSGLRAYGCPAGGVYAITMGSNGASGPLLGMFLEGTRSGASGSGACFRALIWGPKLSSLTF